MYTHKMRWLKIFSCLLNIIFLVISLLMLIFGSAILILLNDMKDHLSLDEVSHIKLVTIWLMAIGFLIFFISFIGCCGALCMKSSLMKMYAIIMFIILILQFTLTAWVFIKNPSFTKIVSEHVDALWMKNNVMHGYPLDQIQYEMNCCGNNGYYDYIRAGLTVPGTCCGYKNRTVFCPKKKYAHQGCKSKIIDSWNLTKNFICWCGCIIAIFEFFAFTIACSLIKTIRKAETHFKI